ncbi:putative holin-like toxin [Levilactobacillus namurensis]|uniref:putative holin-like toxin n=1 Tax=Levilactobacillus namurensis TaxID=380393 RepID=UPI0036F21BEB
MVLRVDWQAHPVNQIAARIQQTMLAFGTFIIALIALTDQKSAKITALALTS